MLAYVCLPGTLHHSGSTMWCAAAVLDDGLLDVAYVMNYPREQVPGLLRELMRGREEGDELEVMDCFGSMRVKWLEVHCADGLQVGHSCSVPYMHTLLYPTCTHYCILHVPITVPITVTITVPITVIIIAVSMYGLYVHTGCCAHDGAE